MSSVRAHTQTAQSVSEHSDEVVTTPFGRDYLYRYIGFHYLDFAAQMHLVLCNIFSPQLSFPSVSQEGERARVKKKKHM